LKKQLLLYFFCFLFQLSFAQEKSIKTFETEFKKSFKTKPHLDVKFDSRFSFIRGADLRTSGFKVGISFNRKFKMGLGYNQLIIPTKSTIKIDELKFDVELEYDYLSPYFEYVYYNSKRWEFNISTQIGFGRANYQYYNPEIQKTIRTRHSNIISYEPAMLIDYKIIRWVGIGTGVGYRLVLYKNSGIEEKISSPVYIVKLKIYLGEIVRTITGKEIQAE
jgi:hypothetical protein